MKLDADEVRKLFPVLGEKSDGSRTIYLDSANTSQKPEVVIESVATFLRLSNAPINRSAYTLAASATQSFEEARSDVARFINAYKPSEVIFTKNATESLNLVVGSWGRANLKPGDKVLLTHLEHHSNIVPWQILARDIDIELRWVPLTSNFELDLSSLDSLLRDVKVFSFSAMSNVLGTINPVEALCTAAHKAGAIAIVDACQSVPHTPTDVQKWGADFIAFSSHKMCGPTGVGILWGRESILDAMPPFLGGGNMISDVRLNGFDCAELPAKFEAGTPPIAEVIGLGTATRFLASIGMHNIRQHEIELNGYIQPLLEDRFGNDIKFHGPRNPELRGATFSFAFRDIHPHDISQVLDESNVCVRAGHHCAKPLMKLLGANATTRASFYLYNTKQDADTLADALEATSRIF